MSTDQFHPAIIRAAQLNLGVATTTRTCRNAQRAHSLAATSTIALGRLLTAAALTALVRDRSVTLSLQVLCKGRLNQVYADITPEGDARGYIKNATLSLPLFPEESVGGRRSIAPAVGGGVLSVIREPRYQEFTQSSTPLVSGEIDLDVAHFLHASDQVPTALACDVLLDESDAVASAGGIIVQAMPGADLDRLAELHRGLSDGGFATKLATHDGNPLALLTELAPDAQPLEQVVPLRWKCRCSKDRVVSALHLLDALQLAEMVEQRETARVTCDFCGTVYAVPPEQIAEIFSATSRGKN